MICYSCICLCFVVFFFKQKTAYELRISDWSSDVCSSDLWIHFDKERCVSAGFGNTIAPGLLTQAYFSKLWFDMVDIVNIPRMLFLGSDKVRLLAPLKCEQEFTMTVTVANVEDKDNGIAVYLSEVWNVIGQEKPVTIDRKNDVAEKRV